MGGVARREGVAVSDPKMAQVLLEIGEEFGWKVDVVEWRGRTLIVREGTQIAIGEVKADGERVMYTPPVSLMEVV